MTALAIPNRVAMRVFERVEMGEPDECWPWSGPTNRGGYGVLSWWDKDHGVNSRGHKGSARNTTAHRVAWTSVNGPIPDDLTVDHICRNILCCNPAHLRLLTNEANGADNGNARKTHCPQGHPYDEANTYFDPDGRGRRCRTCARERDRTSERVSAQRVRRARHGQELAT